MVDFAPVFLAEVADSPQVHFVFDIAAGQIVYVNSAYERVLDDIGAGLNTELPNLLAGVHPDDRAYLAKYWSRWVRGKRLLQIDVRLLHRDQRTQWFTAVPYYYNVDANAPLLGCTLNDISAAKHHQENSDLFNSRKNVTLEVLSHDASGAFILVEQLAQYLREEVPEPALSHVIKLLGVLENTSRDSVKLIRDLINIEFTAAVSTTLKLDRVELGRIMRGPLEQLQLGHELLAHHFAFTLPAEPVYVNLDVSKFTQVIINLVSNALKFTQDDGHVTVNVARLPGHVRLEVKDDGIGIPAAMLPHLFERFTRARRLGLRGEATTGLGLSLCKTIVEWHHGTLSATSTEGKGSCFTVELPVADGVSALRPSEQPEALALPLPK